VVLVEVAPGRFEPREVRLGQREGDRVAVLEGVRAGETVVVSGNFLIDAESNLSSALQGMAQGASAASGEDAADDHSGHAIPEGPPAAEAPAAREDPATPDPHAGHAEGN
jgi:Cu(I)/Ag(I) efflux system membrane fusion protein